MLRRLSNSLLPFAKNAEGNFGAMLAIAAVPLFGVVGAAIDYARLYDAKSELKTAMDSAVLAGTRALMENGNNKTAALAVARSFFDSNAANFASLTNEEVTFTLNAKGTGIVAKGNADLATSFLALLNIDKMPLFPKSGASASAEIGSPGSDLEISLMLDVTGSMCDDGEGPCTSSTKLTALKEAAAKLIETVVWKDQTEFTSKVAVVPFSTRVRVAQDGAGGAIMQKLTGLPPTWSGWYRMCTSSSGGGASETSGNWTCNQYTTQYYANWKIMPCVTDRFYDSGWDFELTDTAPGPGYWLNGHDGSRMVSGPDSSTSTATSDIGASSGDPATHWNYEDTSYCSDVANSNEILSLTNDNDALKARINGLEAYGATAGVLGTAFAWYLLSPEWNNIWTGQSAPKDYSLLTEKNADGKPKLRKVAVLMTDGAYNTLRGWKEQELDFMSENAIAMCNAMKSKGIEIYTVGFALDNLTTAEKTAAQNTLSACGTDVDHFYQSLNIQQLTAAFSTIANKVAGTAVRLVE